MSRLVAGFLGVSKMNSVSVQVCRNRKREVSLIVPGLYRTKMKKSRFGKVLVKKIKERCRYFNVSLEQDIISEPALRKRDTVSLKTK